MKWLALYLELGAAYLTITLATMCVMGVIEQEKKTYEEEGLAHMVIVYATILLAWPACMVLVVLQIVHPVVRNWGISKFRREYLDRDGLLKPQMSAKRCEIHGTVLVEEVVLADGKPTLRCDECLKDLRSAQP